MNVTVIDYKLNEKDRNNYHVHNLKKLNIENPNLLLSIDIKKISELKSEILMVHKSNPEFNRIESSPHDGKYRIFFSDGYHSINNADDFDYYVPYKELYKLVKSLLNDLKNSEKKYDN